MAMFRFAAGQKSISADDLVVFAEIIYFDISTCVQDDVATCDDEVRRKSIKLPVSQFLVLVTNYHVLRISSAVTSLILSASLKLVGGWMCTY